MHGERGHRKRWKPEAGVLSSFEEHQEACAQASPHHLSEGR